jgi:hypothetical protein
MLAAVRGTPGPSMLSGAAAAIAAATFTVAVAPAVPIALAGLAAMGVSWSLFLSSVIATLQGAEVGMLGRVMALFAALLIGSTTVGGPIAAFLADLADPRAPFLLGALAAIASAQIGRGPKPGPA